LFTVHVGKFSQSYIKSLLRLGRKLASMSKCYKSVAQPTGISYLALVLAVEYQRN